MPFWKAVAWITLAAFLLASGMWVFVAFYWGWKSAAGKPASGRAAWSDDDALAVGYLLGRHS